MSSKTVAVMGGAFDPVHRDHVYVAELCLKKGFCDEVWFVYVEPEKRIARLEETRGYTREKCESIIRQHV